MTVDGHGNVYITGISDSLGTGADFITIKYNTDGDKKWSRRHATTSSDVAEAIAVDNNGNVYVTGVGPGTGFGSDYVTIKYDSMGVEQWVEFFDGGDVQDAASGIVTDGVNVYVTGISGGSYATIKYEADGEKAWAKRLPASVPQANAIALDKFNNVYVTGAAGTNYLTFKYSSFGTFQWSQDYNGPGNNNDEAFDIAVDHLGNVYVTGSSIGNSTGLDYATIKYGQPGGPGAIECWQTDTFDNLSIGSLNGQNGWSTVPGRSAVFVVSNPFGAGQVLKMDARANETVIMGKNVNNQTSGTHSIKLNVLVDGNPDPAEPTLAKVEIRTTGNPNWDKKFQLYFGAHMRLNFGPTLPQFEVFLPADSLVLRRWYEVEAVVDLNTNLVDVFLDGELKLNDILVGPGPITDIGISAWDRRGIVYYDNLNFCRVNSPPPNDPCFATSFFDVDDDGWTVIGDAQGTSVVPDHFRSGGNPGGYVSATDDVTGGTWFWQAPSKFLGDASCAYGQALNFDLRQSSTNNQFDWEDVVLEGNGLTLVFDTPCNPGLCSPGIDWTSYSVPLLETAGWTKDDSTDGVISGEVPTQEEMQAVLASLTKLWIRGEFVSGSDMGGLDNVVLKGIPKGVGPLRCASVNIESEEGDGDGRPEAGELIGLSVDLGNDGIETAIGVMGTLTTLDPDIDIQSNQITWPDIATGDTVASLGSFDFEINSNLSLEKVVTFTLTAMASNGGPWACTFDIVVSPENLPPSVINPIPDTTLAAGDSSFVRDLNTDPAVFDDPDQDLDALSYTVTSSDSEGVTATIEGSLLALVAADTGAVTITVTADDSRGGVAKMSFSVQVDFITSVESPNDIPIITDYRLYNNYPNPFNPTTTIHFDVPNTSEVKLIIYDIIGREVKNLVEKRYEMGAYSVSWDGRDNHGKAVSTGIYFVQMRTGDFSSVNKMALVK